MKNIINKNKNKMIHTKFKLSDGSFTMDGTTVNNKFNEFFINIGPNFYPQPTIITSPFYGWSN